jgi:hypothetical protein
MDSPSTLFLNLPAALREELIECYRAIITNYAEARWEPAELNGGKFCEIVYSILHGALVGAFPLQASKPVNMVAACRALENLTPPGPLVGERSLRILIPRLLPYLYEIRNNRGVGHVGGDVNPNVADAGAVLSTCSWVMAELVRIFHGTTLESAQNAVDSLVTRRHPLVWSVDSTKRVLDSSVKASDQVLLLLYSEPGWCDVGKLQQWVEYKNKTAFRTKILASLHKARLIEYRGADGLAKISPLGLQRVEADLGGKLAG